MFLSALALRDFRNYAGLELCFGHGVNVLFGKNAQGKTNILEAIYLLARSGSHRAERDSEMVRWGADSFLACGTFSEGGREFSVEVSFGGQKGKQVRVNRIPKKAAEALLPEVRVVMFVPDDLQIVKGPAALRRKFMDQQISSVNVSYAYDLARYTRVLSQRNSLLRTGLRPSDPTVEVWTEQLVQHGSVIYRKRLDALLKISPTAKKVHRDLTGSEQLEVTYRPSVPITGKETMEEISWLFQRRLSERAQLEQQKGMTLVGPHRDDIAFSIDGQDARHFGSQGQQRSVVVSMKVAELHHIKSETGTYPILLLDDILSELDASRRHGLLNAVEQQVQLFLTCTDYAAFSSELPERTSYYRVHAGKVEAEAHG